MKIQKAVKFQKIDHVGIAVKDLNSAITKYEKLGFKLVSREVIAKQEVEVAMFAIGMSFIELIASTKEGSVIDRFIKKNNGNGGIQQLAITVSDINSELERLKQEGIRLINQQAVDGAHGTKVAFIHPKDTEGVLLELCEHQQSERK